MANNFTYDYTNLLASSIGTNNGISKEEILSINDLVENAYFNIFKNPVQDTQEIINILDNVDTIKIKETASKIRQNFEYFVVFGIGGSSLGSKAIFNALCHLNHNDLPKAKRNSAPKFFVEDNVDPEKLQALFDVLELEKTKFCIITKSGKTTETLAQFFAIREICEKQLGNKWKEHFIIMVSDTSSFLFEYSKNNNLEIILDPPANLGGRYSVLSSVGLLPSAVLGLNIDDMLDGAKAMLKNAQLTNIWQNAPLLSATIDFLNYKKGKNMIVLNPYASGLQYFNEWFCQLWAESIGRNEKNNPIGQTPINVLGPVAQHSQFQLYLDGPNDKIFTFVGVQNFRTKIALPQELNLLFVQDVASNKNFGDLINIERIASTQALTKYNKPNETIIIDELNENTLGKLFMFFIFKMIFIAQLLEINPYGQPAVESIKLEVSTLLKNDTAPININKIDI